MSVGPQAAPPLSTPWVPLWPLAPVMPVQYGTTLPGSPVDGQEAILVDSLTAPTYQWRFRYNAGASGANKWEFVGGSDARVNVDTDQTTTQNNQWVNLATVGPDFVVPRAGDYEVFMQAQAYGVATPMYVGIAVGDTSPSAATSGIMSASVQANIPAARGVLTGLAAGATLRMRYFMVAAGTGHWSARVFYVRPLRVA